MIKVEIIQRTQVIPEVGRNLSFIKRNRLLRSRRNRFITGKVNHITIIFDLKTQFSCRTTSKASQGSYLSNFRTFRGNHSHSSTAWALNEHRRGINTSLHFCLNELKRSTLEIYRKYEVLNYMAGV